jgi:plasmid stabilization system protein ParE
MNYQLTPQAEEDLKQIARYTLKTWGKKQSLKYADILEACFEKIANRTAIARVFSKNYPQGKFTRCEHHYVFYMGFENRLPCIIAVLHESMDIVSRLEERFELE